MPVPFTLEHIDHVLILVSGIDRALAFYEAVLGAEVETCMPAHAMIELRAGFSRIALVDIEDRRGSWAKPRIAGGRNVDHVAFRLTSGPAVEQVRAYLAQRSIGIIEEREESDGYSLYVKDPDDNTIELIVTSRG
jgi:catechol 2,3-dioxygenase-like lactoylglutathione lyase family enzyme